MKHLFIINPKAGGFDRTEEIREKTAGIFSPEEDYELFVTSYAGEATAAVKAYAKSCDELRVYSVGGDGTLNECVNGAAGLSNVSVTCVPGGTGNDFVRMFGEEKNCFRDLEALVRGVVRPLDLIEAGDRYGINICSVGIDARIGAHVHDFTKYPFIGGTMAYVCSLIANVLKGLNQPMTIRFDDKVIDGNVTLACACNGRFYGGGFNPVPDARPDDGLIDFIVVKDVTLLNMPPLLLKYAKGRYSEISEKYLTYFRGTELTISSEEELCVNIDGEEERTHEVTFRMVKGGVNFIFPSQMAFFASEKEKIAVN